MPASSNTRHVHTEAAQRKSNYASQYSCLVALIKGQREALRASYSARSWKAEFVEQQLFWWFLLIHFSSILLEFRNAWCKNKPPPS
jgi:hypothetical protein